MTDDQFRELKALILDVAMRIEAVEAHLTRQDREAMEILASSRRLMLTLEAIDEGEDDADPLQN